MKPTSFHNHSTFVPMSMSFHLYCFLIHISFPVLLYFESYLYSNCNSWPFHILVIISYCNLPTFVLLALVNFLSQLHYYHHPNPFHSIYISVYQYRAGLLISFQLIFDSVLFPSLCCRLHFKTSNSIWFPFPLLNASSFQHQSSWNGLSQRGGL